MQWHYINAKPFYFDLKLSFDASSDFNLHLLIRQQSLIKSFTVITLSMFPFLHFQIATLKEKISSRHAISELANQIKKL